MTIPIDRLPRRRADARFPKVEHREIHRLLDAGVALGRIARQFGRTEDAIRYHQIQCAAVHARFTVGPSDPIYHEEDMSMPNQKLTPAEREEIRAALLDGVRPAALAEKFGVTTPAILGHRKRLEKKGLLNPPTRGSRETASGHDRTVPGRQPGLSPTSPAVTALNAKRIELAAKRDRLQAEIEAKDAELIRTRDDISALEAAIEIMQESSQ